MVGKSNSSVKKPQFFKILLGDFKHRLKLPPKFMKNIAKEVSPKVILHGPYGSSRQVELSKTTTGNFLSSGWSNFVKDHSLKEHEFLLFRYDGDMHFKVMIFETTACEREGMCKMKTPKKSAYKGKKRHGRRMNCSLDRKCSFQHQLGGGQILSLLSDNKDASKKLHGQHTSPEHSMNGRIETEDAGQHISPEHSMNGRIETEDADLSINNNRWQTVYFSKKIQKRSKEEEAAKSFHSSFPYAVMRMTPTMVNKTSMMRLPLPFSHTHLPRIKTDMVLIDPNGKEWTVTYIYSGEQHDSSGTLVKRKQNYFSRGWKAFAHGNYLEEGDFCAFELIGEVELKVHIFRRVETSPLQLSEA